MAERFLFREGLGVDFPGEREAGAAGFGKADDFLQPVRAGGLDVESGTGAGDGALDGGVDRELVGAGMHGEFQGFREAICGDCVGDDGEVVVEFLFELGGIADVIDALVETSGELRCDGLDRDALVGDGGEDHQQFRRGLRAVGFVHGNLGHEIRALRGDDVVIDRFRFLGGFEELVGGLLDIRAGNLERLGYACDGYRADEFRMFVDKRGDIRGIGGLADVIGDIEGEEIAGRDEAIHRLEVDVVGIQQILARPAEFGHGLVGGVAGGLRLGADDVVLAVRLVPDRCDVDAEVLGGDEGLELCVRAVGEAVTDSEGVFGAGFHFVRSYLLLVVGKNFIPPSSLRMLWWGSFYHGIHGMKRLGCELNPIIRPFNG